MRHLPENLARTAVGALAAALAVVLAVAGCSDPTPAAALPVAGYPSMPSCSGDDDGVVDPGELDFSPGRVAPYAVQAAQAPSVQDSGDAAAGRGLWDFSATPFAERVEVPLLDPRRQWYAERFPEATLALEAGGGSGEPGPLGPTHLVLRSTPAALEILGLASVAPQQTLIVYAQPIPMMRFPLALGERWSARSGVADGSLWQGSAVTAPGPADPWCQAGCDAYTFAVDGRGTLRLPGMSMAQVLRLSVTVSHTMMNGTSWSSAETYLVHECLGTVARRSEPAGPWWVVWYPM